MDVERLATSLCPPRERIENTENAFSSYEYHPLTRTWARCLQVLMGLTALKEHSGHPGKIDHDISETNIDFYQGFIPFEDCPHTVSTGTDTKNTSIGFLCQWCEQRQFDLSDWRNWPKEGHWSDSFSIAHTKEDPQALEGSV